MNNKDSILWDEMRAGSRSALHLIYEAHVTYLYNYGRKINNGDTSQVEDVIHDLFVDLWTKRDNIGSTDNIRPYLASSLRRSLVRQLRRSMKVVGVDDQAEVQMNLEDNIEDWMVAQDYQEENAAKLKQAYTTLTSRQREIIYLRYHQNMDYEDIAEVLGVKYQSLRNLLSNAIGGLRAAMATATIFCIALCMSCSTDAPEIEVDIEVQPYFDRFIEEAELRGLEVTDEFQLINAEVSSISSASGQCVTTQEGIRTIRIDQSYWDRVNDAKREFLIFHELGHCYLGLDHDDTQSADGTCASMMMSGLGDCRGNYNTTTRERYLDQLFGL